MLCAGGAMLSRLRAQESREDTEIAPGISLLSVATMTPNGPLRYWLVKAKKSDWQLGLEVADSTNVLTKRNVRALATQSGATVAVNGGFFAYGGAAVGAVKTNGEWHRLPWKTRTALAWDEKRAQIGALSGRCELIVTLQDGTFDTYNAALNGFAYAGTHTPITNGFCILTRRFGPKIKLKTGQTAFLVRGNQIIARDLSGEISWPSDAKPTDFYVVMNGKAALDKPMLGVAWNVIFGEGELDKFPNILGAGPLLIQKSRVKTTEIEEEFRPDVIARGPRTAVGFDSDGNTLFLVADGRQAASVGLTIPETALLFQSLGAVQALNLDGGSSTQLVINGQLINTPSGYDPVNPARPREVRVTNALILKSN